MISFGYDESTLLKDSTSALFIQEALMVGPTSVIYMTL